MWEVLLLGAAGTVPPPLPGQHYGEHALRPFDELARRRIGGVLARRGACARPGSETTGRSAGAGEEKAATGGIVSSTVHDACGDNASDQAAA